MGGPPPVPTIDIARLLADIALATTDETLASSAAAQAVARTSARYDAVMSIGGTVGMPPAAFSAGGNQPGSVANPLTMDQAQALYDEFKAQTDRIPFDYPRDGCFARAHEMCRMMEEKGMQCGKVWNYGNLSVPGTPLGDITWGYHVAPIINVRQPDGSVVAMVMDPSMAPPNGPVPITSTPPDNSGWTNRQNDSGSYTDTTDSSPFYYHPNGNAGLTIPDTDNSRTEAVLEHFQIMRDLVYAGKAP